MRIGKAGLAKAGKNPLITLSRGRLLGFAFELKLTRLAHTGEKECQTGCILQQPV